AQLLGQAQRVEQDDGVLAVLEVDGGRREPLVRGLPDVAKGDSHGGPFGLIGFGGLGRARSPSLTRSARHEGGASSIRNQRHRAASPRRSTGSSGTGAA